MKKISVLLPLLFLFSFYSISQSTQVPRPKLVVGIVIDQMRWDYLYRYYDRYAVNGGFRRMLGQGFSCENTLINYTPTVTACGHSSIYTGTVPAIHGITGNIWWDRQLSRAVYCTEDKTVSTVGSNSTLGQQSPRNLLVTTICDELRLATNFRSKAIGISLKDRGGILPAGHSANAAYWYDNSVGTWISSTYYMQSLPAWVQQFNGNKWPDKYFAQGWNLLYPAATYLQSEQQNKPYINQMFGKSFPYDLTGLIGKGYSSLPYTPYGNTLTTEFAKAAIINEQLGADQFPDIVAISYSSPDYIGHSFGPNSLEAEDGFLRLDKELGGLLDFLDQKVGKNQYLLFLSADHGVSQIPEYLNENKLPAGRVFMNKVVDTINKNLSVKYGIPKIIVSVDNYQLHFNNRALDSVKVDKKALNETILAYLSVTPGVLRAFPISELNIQPLPETIRKSLNNGYYPRRNGEIQVILQSHFIDAFSSTGTTHGLWNPYDAHIPLLWYGWGIRQGKTNREINMTDIAPTVAALLHIQMPSGTSGRVIEEVMK